MNAKQFREAMRAINHQMLLNKEELGRLDAAAGDGDLGISMSAGFAAVCDKLVEAHGEDLGQLMMESGRAFNEAAPSSLGTILSMGMIGAALDLKGKTDCSTAEMAAAMKKGLARIMERAQSKPGEKTILDALCPAVQALHEHAQQPNAWQKAAQAAQEGMERTRMMRSVHGRSAYYGDKTIGHLDGGAVVGKLIFEAIAGL